MVKNERFTAFAEDIYGGLGFCYSLNPNFKEDALTDPTWEMLWHYTLCFDSDNPAMGIYSGPQIRKGSLYGIELGANEVLMELERYNDVFGADYTRATLKDFVPHTTTVTHYKHFDQNTPLFTEEIKIVGLFVYGENNIAGTFVVGDGVWDLFAKDYIYTTGLLFDGTENIDIVIDLADEMNFQHLSDELKSAFETILSEKSSFEK